MSIPIVIEGMEKVERNSGLSVITLNVSLDAIPNIKNRKPNQKINFPNLVCFFIISSLNTVIKLFCCVNETRKKTAAAIIILNYWLAQQELLLF
jgi:hypothetical protein